MNERDLFLLWVREKLERESRMRLFQQLHQNDDPDCGEMRRRPNGEILCGLCGLEYNHHPLFEEERSSDSFQTDVRLCTGEVVHL